MLLRQKRKLAARLSLALAAMLVLAACSSDDAPEEPEAPAETPDAAPEPEAPEEEEPEDPFADAREFYDGAVIDFVVGTGTGGGYDSYARLLAPCLSENIGARIDVRNEPGAGGLVAMNNLLRQEPDGLSIGFMNGPGNVSANIADLEGARFDMSQFTMIARYTGGTTTLATSPASGFETWDDVQNADREIIWGTTGIGSQSHLNTLVIANVFNPGTENRVVAGFDGSAEAELALLRGETDLMSGGLDSRRAAIDAGDAIALMMIDDARHPDFPDVPHILDFEEFDFLDADAQAALQNHVAVNALDRMLVTPGDIPADRLAFLEWGVQECLTNDADFQEAAEAQGRWEAISFLTSEELTAMFNEALNPTDGYRELVVASFEG